MAASGYSEDSWKLVLKFLENEVLFTYEATYISLLTCSKILKLAKYGKALKNNREKAFVKRKLNKGKWFIVSPPLPQSLLKGENKFQEFCGRGTLKNFFGRGLNGKIEVNFGRGCRIFKDNIYKFYFKILI